MPDVVALQDSRLHPTAKSMCHHHKHLKQTLPPGYWVHVIPAAKTAEQPLPLEGTILMCSPRLRVHQFTEICSYGSLVQLTFTFHTYHQNWAPQLLHAHRQPCPCQLPTMLPEPASAVQEQLVGSLHLAICALRKSTDAVILVGDFNANVFRPDRHNLHGPPPPPMTNANFPRTYTPRAPGVLTPPGWIMHYTVVRSVRCAAPQYITMPSPLTMSRSSPSTAATTQSTTNMVSACPQPRP